MDNNLSINKIALKGRISWIYIKYLLIFKVLIGLIFIPSFDFAIKLFIKSSGRDSITSGDYLNFFMSIQGVMVILLGLLFLVILVGIDINTFIVISSLVEEKKLDMKLKGILEVAIKSMVYFISPIGIVFVLFIALVVPIIDVGVNIGTFSSFKIPAFIMEFISKNSSYSLLYTVVLIFIVLVVITYIFTLHFIIVDKKTIAESLRLSRCLMAKYWNRFIVDYFWNLIKIFALCLLVGAGFMLVLTLFTVVLSFFYLDKSVWLIMLFLSGFEIISLITFVSGPIAIYVLTRLFYKYNRAEGVEIKTKFETGAKPFADEKLCRKIKTKTKVEVSLIFIVIVVVNFALSISMDADFSEIYRVNRSVQIIGHRAGGDLSVENTIAGVNEAIEKGADWTEVDVQRSKDGEYIINHDNTFTRIAGVSKKPSEMTLDQIKNLNVVNKDNSDAKIYKVPTLDEVLNVAQNKIGVFIELKGKTADQRMVDDIVKLIKQKEMIEQCVVMSLDYSLISYIEDNYPEIQTGYLYFFLLGDVKKLKGDYMIMEQREATPNKILAAHKAGKKVVVWTVNKPKSIKKFIYSDVDGIITDKILNVQKAVKESKTKSKSEVIINNFSIF